MVRQGPRESLFVSVRITFLRSTKRFHTLKEVLRGVLILLLTLIPDLDNERECKHILIFTCGTCVLENSSRDREVSAANLICAERGTGIIQELKFFLVCQLFKKRVNR